MNCNYPLLKTIEVKEDIIDFLNKKFDSYIENDQEQDSTDTCFSRTHEGGFQTSNLLEWEDDEHQNFLNTEILNLIHEKFGFEKERIEYKWNHMLQYGDGGSMERHNHMHNEDFVIFIYLNTCKSSGNTNFYLNHHNEESLKRSKVSVRPQKGTGVCFSALLLHEGEESYEEKRIFVVGFRLV